eukprot:6214772-Prymnesium_polylepis.2
MLRVIHRLGSQADDAGITQRTDLNIGLRIPSQQLGAKFQVRALGAHSEEQATQPGGLHRAWGAGRTRTALSIFLPLHALLSFSLGDPSQCLLSSLVLSALSKSARTSRLPSVKYDTTMIHKAVHAAQQVGSATRG